ncbi:MAG TPA: pirin-like C-terminal cupin domain-containing protein [Vicinamibacterales bacterium]|nr:pirin-like C-terminal cupin domain-containing protein [Vicinamibacterales bacterium]
MREGCSERRAHRSAQGPGRPEADGCPLGSGEAEPDMIGNRSMVLFDSGDEVVVQAGDEGMRFLLVSGKPIEEPVAWHGPIVMNTRQELQQAMDELNRGTFIKQRV